MDICPHALKGYCFMDRPLISIIVPVYKAEAYLKQCVDSIRNQTYRNLEIILVDDGSPDACGAMCDAFAKEDERIRVIHKENGGQSSARNRALDVMRGEYVGFVDSDDWIELDMFETLYQNMVTYGAQISACGCRLENADGTVRYFNPAYPAVVETKRFTKQEALANSITNRIFTFSLCDKLFHRSIFDDLRMSEGKIYEDQEIIPECIERANTLVYTTQPYYNYRRTEESTTRGKVFSSKMFGEGTVALARAQEYQTRHPELYDQAYAYYVRICLSQIHACRKVKECEARRKEMIKELRGKLPCVLPHLNRNDQIKLRALRISPLLYTLLMKVNDLVKR